MMIVTILGHLLKQANVSAIETKMVIQPDDSIASRSYVLDGSLHHANAEYSAKTLYRYLPGAHLV